MSGENITNNSVETQNLEGELHSSKKFSKKRVDINVLLNRVRADKKKEKLESSIFFGIISLTVILVGVIVSL